MCLKMYRTRLSGNTKSKEMEQAYTMGIQTIMQAKKVLLIASGEDKAEAVKAAFFGPVTPKVPASILQLHSDCVVVADEAALSLCDL